MLKAYEVYRSTKPDNLYSPANLVFVAEWSDYAKYKGNWIIALFVSFKRNS